MLATKIASQQEKIPSHFNTQLLYPIARTNPWCVIMQQ